MRIWYHPERKVEYRPVFAQFPYETRILHVVHPDGRIVNPYTNNDLKVRNHAGRLVVHIPILDATGRLIHYHVHDVDRHLYNNYILNLAVFKNVEEAHHYFVNRLREECQSVLEDGDDESVSIGIYDGMDFSKYEINKYSAIQRGMTIVKEIPVPLGHPRVFIFDKKSRRNIHVQVHKLMANTFLRDDFSEERNIIDHINSDKNNNRLSNLRILTTAENNLFSHGVFVLAIDKHTEEETLFPSINHCAAAFFSLYPNLRSYLKRHLEYETVTHLFYRDLPAKYRRGEKFYVDTE